jgi:pimeloyl-ACP methyl ester carboxylesterase
MPTLRTYGTAPFTVAVIHGGPGAGGEMAPVARELSGAYGVLEPIQTAPTLDGQVEELEQVLEAKGQVPVSLVGYSWGAWLSFIVAARYPALVSKLILVSSGPFEAQYVSALEQTRQSRLNAEARREFEAIVRALGQPATPDKDTLLARLGALAAKTDTVDALPGPADDADRIGPRGDVFQGVWEAAAEMRRSGELLGLAQHLRCPVLAIHGDYDPHPAEGVEKPLSQVLPNFRFVRLEQCGHTPWLERHARERFFQVLREGLAQ